MCRCIETIRIEDGRPHQLAYHQRRLDATRRELFPGAGPLQLSEVLPAALPQTGLHKLRLTYAERLIRVEVEQYQRRAVASLKCVVADDIDYRFKWADRSALQRLLDQRGDADEIIIVRRGLVTDSSYSNLVFYDGVDRLTPAEPLLSGTMRQRLLQQRAITAESLSVEKLQRFSCVSLINAMNPLGEVVVPIEAVQMPDG